MPNMEAWGEWILPSGSFQGPGSGKALRNARCLTLLFYMGLGGVFVWTLVALCFSGRVEVMRTGYKVDMIEAPSIVVCPFNSGTTIQQPADLAKSLVVTKYGTKGPEAVNATVKTCKFDRVCICAEMYDAVFQDHKQHRVENIGLTGKKSERAMVFRERIEVDTHLMDPSDDKTLKVGFYDSVDQAPMWFYMKQGAFVLGSLELQSWTVSDFTLRALKETFQGQYTAVAETRHIFRYTSQEVAPDGDGTDTRISYQMMNFFVDETVSSESAFSVYTLGFLMFLVAVRSAVISVFIATMFPTYEAPKPKGFVLRRELSSIAQTISGYCSCCCCCPTTRDASVEEHAPLKEP